MEMNAKTLDELVSDILVWFPHVWVSSQVDMHFILTDIICSHR